MAKYERKSPTTMRLKGFWRDRRGDGQRFIYKLERYFWYIRVSSYDPRNGFGVKIKRGGYAARRRWRDALYRADEGA